MSVFFRTDEDDLEWGGSSFKQKENEITNKILKNLQDKNLITPLFNDDGSINRGVQEVYNVILETLKMELKND